MDGNGREAQGKCGTPGVMKSAGPSFGVAKNLMWNITGWWFQHVSTYPSVFNCLYTHHIPIFHDFSCQTTKPDKSQTS